MQREKLGAYATVLFQITNAYLFKIVRPLPRVMNLLFTITITATINLVGVVVIAGVVVRRLPPANPDLFLDHAIFAKKIS
jgi:hypothetical protein